MTPSDLKNKPEESLVLAAKGKGTPKFDFYILMDSEYESVRLALSRNKAVPFDVVFDLIKEGGTKIQKVIAGRADITKEACEILLSEGDASVVKALAKNPYADREVLSLDQEMPEKEKIIGCALSSQSSGEDLNYSFLRSNGEVDFSTKEKTSLDLSFANNRNSTEAILFSLVRKYGNSQSFHEGILKAITSHPSTNKESLRAISLLGVGSLSSHVARHKNTDSETLNIILEDLNIVASSIMRSIVAHDNRNLEDIYNFLVKTADVEGVSHNKTRFIAMQCLEKYRFGKRHTLPPVFSNKTNIAARYSLENIKNVPANEIQEVISGRNRNMRVNDSMLNIFLSTGDTRTATMIASKRDLSRDLFLSICTRYKDNETVLAALAGQNRSDDLQKKLILVNFPLVDLALVNNHSLYRNDISLILDRGNKDVAIAIAKEFAEETTIHHKIIKMGFPEAIEILETKHEFLNPTTLLGEKYRDRGLIEFRKKITKSPLRNHLDPESIRNLCAFHVNEDLGKEISSPEVKGGLLKSLCSANGGKMGKATEIKMFCLDNPNMSRSHIPLLLKGSAFSSRNEDGMALYEKMIEVFPEHAKTIDMNLIVSGKGSFETRKFILQNSSNMEVIDFIVDRADDLAKARKGGYPRDVAMCRSRITTGDAIDLAKNKLTGYKAEYLLRAFESVPSVSSAIAKYRHTDYNVLTSCLYSKNKATVINAFNNPSLKDETKEKYLTCVMDSGRQEKIREFIIEQNSSMDTSIEKREEGEEYSPHASLILKK